MIDMMRRVLYVVGCVIVLAGCVPPDEEQNEESDDPSGETAQVVRIIDGDTIDVRMDGETYRVRYVGVNTPEYDEPCYNAATDANAALVEGQRVTLVRDVSNTDQYGRLLRYVYAGEVFVNAELVAEGYAEAGYYPPDTAHLDYFDSLEAQARRAGAGCHPTGVFR